MASGDDVVEARPLLFCVTFLCLAIVFTGHTVGDVENDLVVEKVLVFQERRMDNVS